MTIVTLGTKQEGMTQRAGVAGKVFLLIEDVRNFQETVANIGATHYTRRGVEFAIAKHDLMAKRDAMMDLIANIEPALQMENERLRVLWVEAANRVREIERQIIQDR